MIAAYTAAVFLLAALLDALSQIFGIERAILRIMTLNWLGALTPYAGYTVGIRSPGQASLGLTDTQPDDLLLHSCL